MRLDGPFPLTAFLGDLFVYRNLEPVDSTLPRFAESAAALGLPDGRLPRKTELDYARVVAHIIRQAAEARGSRPPSRLLSVGDTRLNDGTAFRNLQAVTGWEGAAIICTEKPSAAPALDEVEPGLFLANQWGLLEAFDRALSERGLVVSDGAVAVIDLDKTAIGARGRNDHAIDQARLDGVRATAVRLLGSQYDEPRFLEAYHHLNQPPYHQFTADNQDYLVYICLIIGAGVRSLEEVAAGVADGTQTGFDQFINWVQEHRSAVSGTPLADVHDEVHGRFTKGDPTPFKEFRRQEFRATIARMGCLPGAPAVDEALSSEIVITREVAELVERWQEKGALVIGVSDKPDEAALPTPETAAEGLVALHDAATHRVGESLS